MGLVSYTEERDRLLSRMNLSFDGAFLAGGALTSLFSNQRIRDYDIYFKAKADFARGLEYAFAQGFVCKDATARAVTLKREKEGETPETYQLIHFDFHSDPAAIFKAFDFTVCMAAYDFESQEFTLHERFLRDLSKRELVFNVDDPYGLMNTVFRVKKYLDRGYAIKRSEIMKIIMSCSMKRPRTWQELGGQIGGSYGDAIAKVAGKPFVMHNIAEVLQQFDLAVQETQELPASAHQALEHLCELGLDYHQELEACAELSGWER